MPRHTIKVNKITIVGLRPSARTVKQREIIRARTWGVRLRRGTRYARSKHLPKNHCQKMQHLPRSVIGWSLSALLWAGGTPTRQHADPFCLWGSPRNPRRRGKPRFGRSLTLPQRVLVNCLLWAGGTPTRRPVSRLPLAFFGRPVVLPWKSSQVIQSFVVKPSGQRQPIVLLQS